MIMDDVSIGDIISQLVNNDIKPTISIDNDWRLEFQNWLTDQYGVVVQEERESGLHASSIGRICGRRNLIVEAFGAETIHHNAGNYMTFDFGHSRHQWWQNRYLGPKQELLGDWVCMACPCPQCAEVISQRGGSLTQEDLISIYRACGSCRSTGRKVTTGLMPMNCECGTPWQLAIRYLETRVQNDDLHYVGHADGILNHSPRKRLFEFKTINPKDYDKLLETGPEEEHIIQAHAYMISLGLKEALIVYENKATQCKWSTSPMGQLVAGEIKITPFLVRFDDTVWKMVESRIKEYHRSISIVAELKGQRPDKPTISTFQRICNDRRCELAKRCSVVRECFSLD